jgi:uncharacterized protein (TIGR02099 family)
VVIKSHKLRTKIITASAVIVIFVAVIFSLFRIAIPYITDYGDSIEAELSRQLGMPVEIAGVDADIQWLTPRLNLLGVKIYDGASGKLIFSFREINLAFGWLQSFKKMRPELAFVSLNGMELNVERLEDGGISLQGYQIRMDEASEPGLPKEMVEALAASSIYVHDSIIRWTDRLHNGQSLVLTNVNLALLNAEPRHQLSVAMDLPEAYGDRLEFIVDIEGALNEPYAWKGKLYTGVHNLHLARWFDDYWQVLGFVGAGTLDADIWLQWDHKIINSIDARLNANHMGLHYLDDDVRSWKLDHFDGLMRWVRHDNGWSVDMRQAVMNREQRAWPTAAAVSIDMNDSQQYVDARASFLRLEDLAYLGGLVTNFIPVKDFDWNRMFDSYRPRGDLYDVSLHVPLDQPRQALMSGRFQDLGYETTESLPAATGLDGRLDYDGGRTRVSLDSQQVVLEYPDLFRNRLVLDSLRGDFNLYRQPHSWHLSSDELQLSTPHLFTLSRLNLKMPDVGRPFLDIITTFSKGDGRHKSLYFPTSVMPDKTVAWLDQAIVGAEIPKGGFLFYGNIDDYPFSGGEGVMEAIFEVQNGTLQYMPDWPAVENMNASVHFRNRSLLIENGSGSILGADFHNTRLAIDDLGAAHLDISGEVKSALPELLKFVDSSPLRQHFGSYLLGLQTRGPTELDLDIQIPLASEDPTRVSGRLQLIDNEIFFPLETWRFTDLQGGLSFSNDSVAGKNLQARLGEQPLSLDVSSLSDDNGPLIRIDLAGHLPVKQLLAPYPALAEYVDGATDWDINVDIPRDSASRLLKVAVQSELEGVSSRLPGSFAKAAGQTGHFSLGLELFRDGGLGLRARRDQAYELQAERREQRWSVALKSDVLTGQARFMQDFSRDEPIELSVDHVNVEGLLNASEQATKNPLSPLDVPPLNVQIRKLVWGNYQFVDINLESERAERGMLIKHFEAHAPTVNVMGKGSWTSSWRFEDTTSLDFTLDTHNLGQTLSQFGITDSIRETDGTVAVNWTWPAKPYQFDWNIVKGTAKLDLEDGKFSDIDVGAGRVIGILNFETLLSMDFGNQVARGFAFDNMQGELHFDAGNAYTRDVTIESKVAEITLDGRIGLSAEDYDQIITVIPGVGSTLTVIGAVAGGPVTAAAVHLFQKIFGINRIAQYKYSVKGSWEDPQVKLLSAPDDKSGQATDENF